jgi:DNA-binding LytR/AlgR family response regulator
VKVLVVEHQDLAREDLCDELSRLSFVKDVRSAASEQATGEILTSFAPDVIFLDLQLPESGAFRIADRSWAGSVPAIVCVTAFERSLVEALSRHRVEYLVRPFGTQDLHYVMTRGRRQDPIDPALNLKRLLDAAIALRQPVRGRISVWRQGRSYILDGTEIAAIRYDGRRFHLWTPTGVYETTGPAGDVENAIRPSSFRRLYRNALISLDSERFGHELHHAYWWLRRRHWVDVLLRRTLRPATPGEADGLFGRGRGRVRR